MASVITLQWYIFSFLLQYQSYKWNTFPIMYFYREIAESELWLELVRCSKASKDFSSLSCVAILPQYFVIASKFTFTSLPETDGQTHLNWILRSSDSC